MDMEKDRADVRRSRRQFLKHGAAGTIVLATGGGVSAPPGAEPFSEEQAPLRANWIWDNRRTDNQHVFLRRVVDHEARQPRKVLAKVTADDYYKLFLNGKFLAQGPAPAYPRDYLYNVIDLTAAWHRGGKNVIAAHAYYQGLKNYAWVSGDDRRGFWMQLEIEYEDQMRELLVTDAAWRVHTVDAWTAPHKFGYDTGFAEEIDARRLPVGWDQAGFDASAWSAATVQDPALWRLRAQETPLLDVYELRPVRIVQKESGHYFFDFGREIVGTLCLRLKGKAGDVVEIRLGEELTGPDQVRYKLRANCLYQERWTLRDGVQTLEHYDYRAFRYGEVIGAASALDPDRLQAVVRHSPFDASRSDFRCSDPELNRLWELARYSTKMGTQESFQDCPTREKAQYSLDAWLEMNAVACLTGDMRLSRRMLECFLTSSEDGKARATAPAAKDHFFTEYTMYPVLMAWSYFLYTGDTAFLRRNFTRIQAIERYIRSQFLREDGLLWETDRVLKDLVDWPVNRRDGHQILPANGVISALYARLCRELAQISEVADRPEEAHAYRERAAKTQAALNARFWNAQEGRYVDGLTREGAPSLHSALHANAFPLAMGIVPADRIADVVRFIKTRGLNCNLFLAMFLFEALYAAGEGDYALELLTGQGENSPMNAVRKGATTTWEAWDLEQKGNASLFHPAGAFTAYVLVSGFLGIRPTKPGMREIAIRPQCGRVASAEVRTPTPGGAVEMKYHRRNAREEIEVNLPNGTEAVVRIPESAQGDVRLNGKAAVPDKAEDPTKRASPLLYRIGPGVSRIVYRIA